VADPALFERGKRSPDVILGLFRKENACLDRLLGSARQITPWKGVRIHLVKKFRFFEGGMFQVGDAVGNVNPVGGIGLTFALQSSRILASLLKRPLTQDRR
jgi:2-polyprenyl-6-methoxyphenol hydroxylase-like FAD-dependent oxidoreductase